jgi:CheY-like chemotaxis protein
MRILLVEDNMSFGEELVGKLTRPFGEPEWQKTESDFVAAFDATVANPPAVFVIDVMLQWDIPRREGIRPRPEESRDMYKAGIRCAQRLLGNPRTASLPIVLYTLVDRPDLEADIAALPPHVQYLQKASNFEALLNLLREVTAPERTEATRD